MNKDKLIKIEDIEKLNIKETHQLYNKYLNPAVVNILKTFDFGNVTISHAIGEKIFLENGKTIIDATT